MNLDCLSAVALCIIPLLLTVTHSKGLTCFWVRISFCLSGFPIPNLHLSSLWRQSKLEQKTGVFEGKLMPEGKAERPDWRKTKVCRKRIIFCLVYVLKTSVLKYYRQVWFFFNKFLFKKKKNLRNWSEKLNTCVLLVFLKKHICLCAT